MTIKIITRGKNPEVIPLRGTCYNCKTVVECAKEDAHNNYSQLEGDNYSVTCPVCGLRQSTGEYVGLVELITNELEK